MNAAIEDDLIELNPAGNSGDSLRHKNHLGSLQR
jgi:hypothetical protein